jgi:hypothetical protein
MILGRTPSGTIKIKTDNGGLRAVNCACCGGECKRFQLTILGLTFEVSLVNLPYPQPFEENDGRGLRCVYTGGANAGGITTYRQGTDLYCDGGLTFTTTAYTGGGVVVVLTHFIQENVVRLEFYYLQSLDPAGERECIQAFFCTRGTETFNTLYYDSSITGVEFPSQNGTYSVPAARIESHGCCIYSNDPPPPEECYTTTAETTIPVSLVIL